MSATETWEMDIIEMVRQEIVHQKDTGDIISHSDIDDAVRDILNTMDTDDFVDTDAVTSAVMEHWEFNDNVAGIVNSCLEYEGLDALPGEVQSLDERVNALEEGGTDHGITALHDQINNLTKRLDDFEGVDDSTTDVPANLANLTERIVYMEGVINALVDAAVLVTGRTGNVTVPDGNARAYYAQPTDDAPYAAI